MWWSDLGVFTHVQRIVLGAVWIKNLDNFGAGFYAFFKGMFGASFYGMLRGYLGPIFMAC